MKKKYTHLFFDCDGVILNSNKIKTDAFYKLAIKYGEREANELVSYHLKNGGISRYNKIKYFNKFILNNTDNSINESLVKEYSNILKKNLLKADIEKSIYKIKKYFPFSKVAVISGSDQEELRWLFKEKKIEHLFNYGIYGSPRNKIEILKTIFSEFSGKEQSIFIGDSKYDFEVSKKYNMDFAFIYEWTDLEDWRLFVNINDLNAYKNVSTFFYNYKRI